MAGLWAYGTVFKRGNGDGPPETFTTVANVVTVGGLELSRNTEDVTTHGSPESWMEFIGTLKDAGEVTIEANYNPAVHDQFVADLSDTASRTYQIVVPSSPAVTWTFEAVMTGFSQSFPVDGKMAATLSYKVTGKPAFV